MLESAIFWVFSVEVEKINFFGVIFVKLCVKIAVKCKKRSKNMCILKEKGLIIIFLSSGLKKKVFGGLQYETYAILGNFVKNGPFGKKGA